MRAIRRPPGIDTARTDQASSLSQLVTSGAANVATVEPWSSLSAWNPSNACQVSGGKLYGLASTPNPAGGALNMTIASGSTFRFVSTVDLVAGGAGFVGIGLSTSAAPLGVAAANSRMWGLTGSVAQKYFSGSFTNMTQTGGTGGGSTLAAGAYRLSITSDATNIKVSLMNAAGTVEYVDTVSWVTAGAQAALVVWNGDSRALSGCALRGVSFRKALNTTSPRGVYEDTGPALVSTAGGTGTLQVRVPAGYDSAAGCPVVMYYHGSSGDSTSPFTDSSGMNTVTSALLTAGYIVVSLDTGNDWGSQAAIDSYRTAYQWVRDHFAIGQVFHLGQSMGGLASLLTLAARAVPAAGWLGIYPVCNLRNLYDNTGSQGNLAPAIRTAYGIASDGSDYSTKTAGHDPALMDGRAFRGLPMKSYASPSDTVVPKTNNTDQLVTLVSPYASQAPSVVVCNGDHGDASHFQPSSVVAFFDSLADPPFAAAVPAAPGSLQATAGDAQAALTWTAPRSPSSAITDYVVQYRTTSGPGSWVTFADGTSTATSATVTGLADGTGYDFQVAAVNATGTGTYSATASATPVALPAVGGVSGMVLWFKADALALSDAAAVATWADSSGNGYDLTQATGTNQPTYKTGILNGQPVVRFDGTNDRLTRAFNAAWNTPQWSFFAVVVPRGGGGAYRAIVGTQGTDTANGFAAYVTTANTYQILYNGVFTGTGTLAVGTARVCSAVRGASSSAVFTDGAATGTDTHSFTANPNGTLFVGVNAATNDFPMNGDIAEIALWTRALTPTERSNVTAALGSKYGISVS